MIAHYSTTTQPQTLDEALLQIDALQRELEHAHRDPVWGVYTRVGIERRMRHIGDGYALVVADLDGLHDANTRYGHAGVDARMRRALDVRATDFYLGRWFSGDEFVALVPAHDALGFAQRLQARLRACGLSATFAVVDGCDAAAAAVGVTRIEEAKRADQRGKIFVVEGASA